MNRRDAREPELHVVSLRYSVQPEEGFSYDNPPAIQFELPEARFHLNEGDLICEMKLHFPDERSARAAVEPVLRAWEAHSDLRHNRGQLRFRFERAEIVDRAPKPPGSVSVVVCSAELSVKASMSVVPHLTSRRYPEPPPPHFRLSADSETLLNRYSGYLDGREPLPPMAYFCFTWLTAAAGGVKQASAQYNVHRDVLRKLSELSSTRGDQLSARKAALSKPLSEAETRWLEAAIKMLISRLCDSRPSNMVPSITMTDLPTLKNAR